MVDPVPLVAQLLSEIPPLVSFLSELPDESLPTRGTGKGLQAPDSAPWRTAADGVLRELRSDPPPADAEDKKASLRRFLQRARGCRRAAQRL
eukprot:CAMPEP_0203923094 /NCGR_PEP_ID=MMETSP0359-20131031/63051_1 /ASSEMBLY_ACC=CAM_ASM_000338 /TAXON_ID=268821 /ORGANISM="Scrippsiella Hangoei, Strain SHTV-5" /LENGTH=91 /DNA_ID=CAMNT_0050851117 /DNA_START=61 /DNA_END=333 /DNA_ORIENTATION=-